MALKATIHKAELIISDMDRGYYHTHALTLAQHPSETLERLMLRLVVFALHASEQLGFTRGLSAIDEPEVWQKSVTGDIELWINLMNDVYARHVVVPDKCGYILMVAPLMFGGMVCKRKLLD